MNKIIFLCPLTGNGGIASWSKKYLTSFSNEELSLIPIDISPGKDFTLFHGTDRILSGIKSFFRSRKQLINLIHKDKDVKIMHIASGLGYGVIRDYFLAKSFMKVYGKCILHCHNGGIQKLYESKNIIGYFFRRSLNIFHQIWVLDEHSASFLKSKPGLSNKIFLTPNSIDVPNQCVITPKTYKKVGFVGNVIPSKGIYELTEAVYALKNDTQLLIIGDGTSQNIEHIRHLAGDKLGKKIILFGRLSNEEAVKVIESLDIICLPTYYPAEAFPISILEAMSRGKLVISCPRAAIPDMLTSTDGKRCGILVPEKNSIAISEAIIWCQNNPKEADIICKRAYEKALKVYNKDVVYNLYKNNYLQLVHK